MKRTKEDAEENSKSANQGNNVFVQGLAKGTTEAQLHALFSEFGEISSTLI